MNLRKIKPVDPFGVAALARVTCLATGANLPWNEAAAAGWFADGAGVPFAAYYSPEAAATLTPVSAAVFSERLRNAQANNYQSP